MDIGIDRTKAAFGNAFCSLREHVSAYISTHTTPSVVAGAALKATRPVPDVVGRRVLMPLWAVAADLAAKDVLPHCDDLHMSGIAADLHAAQMVDGESIWDGTDQELVREPVDRVRLAGGVAPGAVPAASGGPSPEPAAVASSHLVPKLFHALRVQRRGALHRFLDRHVPLIDDERDPYREQHVDQDFREEWRP